MERCVFYLCIFPNSNVTYSVLCASPCCWFTYCSDRDSVLSSGHRKPCRVPEGNRTLLRSLLPLYTFSWHRHCRSDNLQEHHRSGNGRKLGEVQLLEAESKRIRSVTYVCRVRKHSSGRELFSYFASHSRALVTQVLSLAVDSDVVYAAIKALRGTVRPGTQTWRHHLRRSSWWDGGRHTRD